MTETKLYRHFRSNEYPVDYWIVFENGQWSCASALSGFQSVGNRDEGLERAANYGATSDLSAPEWKPIDLTPPAHLRNGDNS